MWGLTKGNSSLSSLGSGVVGGIGGVLSSASSSVSNLASSAGASGLASSSSSMEPGSVFSLNGRRLSVVKQIGEGGFSFVYKVTDGSQDYALKRMFAIADDPEQVERLRTEVDLLREIRHENVVRVVDIQDGSRPTGGRSSRAFSAEVLILMEFCPGGSLADIVIERSTSNRFFAERQIFQIFHQICKAVSALHLRSPPVFHRDLKVENILINERSDGGVMYQLCDFGSATTRVLIPRKEDRSRIEEEISKVTTPVYQSPEMADVYRGQPIDDKADIWALGCLLYRLAYLALPFNEGERLGILNGRYRIPEQPNYSNIPSMIKKMLESDPADRPDIVDVLNETEDILNIPRSNLPKPERTRAQDSDDKVIKPLSQSAGDAFSELEWYDGGSGGGHGDEDDYRPPSRNNNSTNLRQSGYSSRESTSLRNSSASNHSSPTSSTTPSPLPSRSEVATRQPAKQEPPAPQSLLIDFEASIMSTPQPQPQPQLQLQQPAKSNSDASLFTDDPLFSGFDSSFATPQQQPRPQLSGTIPQNIVIPSAATTKQSQPPVGFPVATVGYGSASNLTMIRPASNFVQPMVGYVPSPTSGVTTQPRMPSTPQTPLQFVPLQPMMQQPQQMVQQPMMQPMMPQRFPSPQMAHQFSSPQMMQPQYFPTQQLPMQAQTLQPQPQQPMYYVPQSSFPSAGSNNLSSSNSNNKLFDDDERFS